MNLKGRTIFMSGGSRGIGLAIALRAAADGANIAIAAKTVEAHAKLEGTIHTAAAATDLIADYAARIKAGGKALALQCDIRDEAQVMAAVDRTVERFGGIDVAINNASAIQLTGTLATDMKRYDLMHQINTRGTFLVSKLCIPHLKTAENPHILMLSPPLDMKEKWFAPHTAYSIAKYGMSLCVLGMAGELRRAGVAVNALWPRTAIATAAVGNLLGGETVLRACRTAEILADAAHMIFSKPSREFTGQFLIDDTFLAANGVTDFARYRVDPDQPLVMDFFVPDDIEAPDTGETFLGAVGHGD